MASDRDVSTEAPASLVLVGERVEDRLRTLLDVELERWGAVDGQLVAPLRCLADLVLAGGKRLRPAFCHWGFVGAGGEGDVTDAGAAFELLHAFALIHDDVMDGSDLRRGRPSAHRVFGDRHDDESWRGESRRFGEGVAILIGDLAFVYADLLMADAPRAARDVFDELRIELNIGQYLDLLGTARNDVGLEGARRIASYKSGKYTVERPLHLGAALAGRLSDLEQPLSAYGLPLGEAFQLRDDVLGAFGDTTALGKPVGDDLREGKPTPLLAIARERADQSQLVALGKVGAADLTDDHVGDLQDVLVATGALAQVEEHINDLTEEAVTAIKASPISGEAQTALTELAHYVAWRDR